MHESRLKWAWASQMDNEHNNMLEMRHRAYKKAQTSVQASPTWKHRHIHKTWLGTNWIIFNKSPSHEHRTSTWPKWEQISYNSETSCKVTRSYQKVIINTYKLFHVMSKSPSHVSTSRYETSHW
jgi:hypothetical protein